jgi:phosphoserine phosphatase
MRGAQRKTRGEALELSCVFDGSGHEMHSGGLPARRGSPGIDGSRPVADLKSTRSHSRHPMRLEELPRGLVVRGFIPPLRLADFRLAAFDMDSTLINIECVDEIAAAAGLKAEVAAITEATMRGEIADFKESLRRRVALLRGVPEQALHEIWEQTLRLNPGVETFLAALRDAGLKTLLVSGGFTFFSDRVAARLAITYTRANVLEIVDGALTGRLVDQPWGDICDGLEKQRMLLQTCAELGISPAQAIAVGDGSNDLPMMGVAGLSIAYHAKPAVREKAMLAINEGGMDDALAVLK